MSDYTQGSDSGNTGNGGTVIRSFDFTELLDSFRGSKDCATLATVGGENTVTIDIGDYSLTKIVPSDIMPSQFANIVKSYIMLNVMGDKAKYVTSLLNWRLITQAELANTNSRSFAVIKVSRPQDYHTQYTLVHSGSRISCNAARRKLVKAHDADATEGKYSVLLVGLN